MSDITKCYEKMREIKGIGDYDEYMVVTFYRVDRKSFYKESSV